jgi:hypothetical protein
MGISSKAMDEQHSFLALFIPTPSSLVWGCIFQENGEGVSGDTESLSQRHLIGKIIRSAG